MWDCGTAPVHVIEHGVVDPGPLWTGELPRIAAVINDPDRRGRLVGADLLAFFAALGPLDLFGMHTERVPGVVARDLPQAELHQRLAQRRVYVHPFRWTSLGLSLIEAMHLGMPVVTLATTEAAEAVPPAAGACSNRMDVLAAAVRRFLADPAEAAEAGQVAREAALARYGLDRFLHDWDRLLKEVTR
jgi:glycosyltransferase involved in cell wall biosynthesis